MGRIFIKVSGETNQTNETHQQMKRSELQIRKTPDHFDQGFVAF